MRTDILAGVPLRYDARMQPAPSPTRMRNTIFVACSVIMLMGIVVMGLTFSQTVLTCHPEVCEIERTTLRGRERSTIPRSDVTGAELQRETSTGGVPAVRVVLKTVKGDIPLREAFSSLSPTTDRRTADAVNGFLAKGGSFTTRYSNPLGFAFGAIATLLGLGVALVVKKMMK